MQTQNDQTANSWGTPIEQHIETTPTAAPTGGGQPIAGPWEHPVVVSASDFKAKSLSSFCVNLYVGCHHACRFCYVAALNRKHAPALAEKGVANPMSQWGEYALLRKFDETKFIASIKKAERQSIPDEKLDGQGVVLLSSTSDFYQTMRHANPKEGARLNREAKGTRRRILELLLDSTLRVRILTRSPLAKLDFELMAEFGDRLLFGMSLPTLDDALSRVYEPQASGPAKRLETLRAAKAAGLNVFVAVAPTYPEQSREDIQAVLEAIKPLEPSTIYHEPINVRGMNVRLIREAGEKAGIAMRTEELEGWRWRRYAIRQLLETAETAQDLGLGDVFHSWPDKSLLEEGPYLKMRRAEIKASKAARESCATQGTEPQQ